MVNAIVVKEKDAWFAGLQTAGVLLIDGTYDSFRFLTRKQLTGSNVNIAAVVRMCDAST